SSCASTPGIASNAPDRPRSEAPAAGLASRAAGRSVFRPTCTPEHGRGRAFEASAPGPRAPQVRDVAVVTPGVRAARRQHDRVGAHRSGRGRLLLLGGVAAEA